MIHWTEIRRPIVALCAASTALLLAACMLVPGKFDSTLNLHRDGSFTYNYTGEITMLGLSELAAMAAEQKDNGEFLPHCWDEETNAQRDCTQEEIETQREEWETFNSSRKNEAQKNAGIMQSMMGGIDPSDPDVGEEIAAKLRRQKGWKNVEYAGKGLFNVEFEITSKLTHDFIFPTIEDMPMVEKFVMLTRRADNSVRITAPGFSAQDNSNPSGMGALLAAAGESKNADTSELPKLEGTFRIITNGTILANNTDEGPRASSNGKVLEWVINSRTKVAPTALIALQK
ncbi:hypothetical protein GRI39_00910 [Altererythrobacter indicus]|uniref:Uncharacterized protein n=1 Tax=Altericroceibacterium indicum TaxID=374177 RepID=A0A845ABQ5_9SPHN|nr:hypothetical protein [Altericroceibacterium indicum]MXP24608.1 hypothetical protein [Altericroceibacterium indicum]